MSPLQIVSALAVGLLTLAVIVQAAQQLMKPPTNAAAKSMVQPTLLLGVFILLVLPIAQSQVAKAPPVDDKKTEANKKAKEDEAKAKLVADAAKKKDAKHPDPAAANGSSPSDADKAKAAVGAAKNDPTARLEDARIDAMDSNYANLSLRDCGLPKKAPNQDGCVGTAYQVKVNDAALRAKLKEFHVGDQVRVDIEKGELKDFRGPWSFPEQGIPGTQRAMVLAACALVLLGLATAVTKGAPLKFIVGMDNRYSNSKFQLAVWFWVVISSYLAVIVFRLSYAGWDFLGGVNIPQHLLELSGLSAITYGGAKAITTAKVDAAAHPVVAPGAVAMAPRLPDDDPKRARQPGQENFFTDLLQNDQGTFDFGDFQMLVVTFVAVGMYMMLIYNFLGSIEFLKTTTLPDVDTTILAGFGLGHGAYLAKKAGGDVGKT